MPLVARYRSILCKRQDVVTFTNILGALDLFVVIWQYRACFGICYVFHSLCIYILLYLTYLTHMISAMLPQTLILQFIAMMKKMPDSENELKEAFTAFDADGDGVFLICCRTYFSKQILSS